MKPPLTYRKTRLATVRALESKPGTLVEILTTTMCTRTQEPKS